MLKWVTRLQRFAPSKSTSSYVAFNYATVDAILCAPTQSDFLVMSCDLISNVPLRSLLDHFRLDRPAMAAFFAENTTLDNASAGGSGSGSSSSKKPAGESLSVLLIADRRWFRFGDYFVY